MSRDLFEEVIGTPPPSTVDLDGIMRGRRRVMLARRLGMALASVVALALFGVGALTVVDRSAPVAPGAPTGFRLATDSPELSGQTAQRLGTALAAAVAAQAPEARWLPAGQPPTIIASDGRKQRVMFAGTAMLAQDDYQGWVDLTVYETVGLGTAGDPLLDCDAISARDGSNCTTGATGSGAPMVVLASPPDGPNAGVQAIVRIALPGGVVEVGADYINPDGSVGQRTPTVRAVLTQDQLRAVATAVADEITP